MREREIPDAQRGELTEDAQVLVDHVSAFDAHQRGDLVPGGRAADVSRRRREHQVARMQPDGLADPVNLLQRGLDRRRPGDVTRSEEHTSELQSRFGISYAV